MLPFIWAIRVHRLGSSACHFFILPDNPAFVSIILFCFNEEFTVRNFGTNVSIKSQPLKIIHTVNRNWSKITNPKTKDVGIHLKKTDLEELIENIQDSPRTGGKKGPNSTCNNQLEWDRIKLPKMIFSFLLSPISEPALFSLPVSAVRAKQWHDSTTDKKKR